MIEITDEFTEPTGEFEGYNVLDILQEEQLRKQKHVDIRSFVADLPSAPVSMLFMDRLKMFYLDEKQLSSFSEADIVVINNEGWTFGEVGPQSDRNNWNGIKVTVAKESEVTTQSVIKQNG